METFAKSYSFPRVLVALAFLVIQNAPAAPWFNTGVTTNGAELYDPATGACKITGSMTLPRRNHSATLLLNGKVLVTGGVNGNTILLDAELYNPATGLWASTA